MIVSSLCCWYCMSSLNKDIINIISLLVQLLFFCKNAHLKHWQRDRLSCFVVYIIKNDWGIKELIDQFFNDQCMIKIENCNIVYENKKMEQMRHLFIIKEQRIGMKTTEGHWMAVNNKQNRFHLIINKKPRFNKMWNTYKY